MHSFELANVVVTSETKKAKTATRRHVLMGLNPLTKTDSRLALYCFALLGKIVG